MRTTGVLRVNDEAVSLNLLGTPLLLPAANAAAEDEIHDSAAENGHALRRQRLFDLKASAILTLKNVALFERYLFIDIVGHRRLIIDFAKEEVSTDIVFKCRQ